MNQDEQALNLASSTIPFPSSDGPQISLPGHQGEQCEATGVDHLQGRLQFRNLGDSDCHNLKKSIITESKEYDQLYIFAPFRQLLKRNLTTHLYCKDMLTMEVGTW